MTPKMSAQRVATSYSGSVVSLNKTVNLILMLPCPNRGALLPKRHRECRFQLLSKIGSPVELAKSATTIKAPLYVAKTAR